MQQLVQLYQFKVMQSLWLFVLFCVQFDSIVSQSGSSLNLKLLIITEKGTIDDDLVMRAVNNRINKNYRVLDGVLVSYKLISSVDSAITAIKQACNDTNYSGIISVGSCTLIHELTKLAKSMHVPHIAIPVNMCENQISNDVFTVFGRQIYYEFSNALIEMLQFEKCKQALILFDKFQSLSVIENIQTKLTALTITSSSVQIDSKNDSVTVNLNVLVKQKVYYIIVVASANNVISLLSLAKDSRVLQQNYHWIVVDSVLSKERIQKAVVADANVALVRGSIGMNWKYLCKPEDLDVFPSCNVDTVKEIDIRFVDAIEIMGKTFNESLNKISPFFISNATCNSQSWVLGAAVYNQLLAITNYNTYRAIISVNASSKHLNTGGVDIISTYNPDKNTSVTMVVSAFYDSSKAKLFSTFLSQQSQVVFANSFVGFKNETILICSPEKGKLMNLLIELLAIFSKQLNFQYTIKAPDDGVWGGPVPNSPVFSGCVGEVQTGKVVFAGGRFTNMVSRGIAVDFSTPLLEAANTILLPTPPKASKMWNLFKPLHYHIWILLLLFLILASLFAYLFAYFSPFSAWNLQLEYAVADEVWFQEYVWSVIGSFLQQGQDFYPFAISPRVVMATWWIFTVIIYGSNTGDLTAHLTVTDAKHIIRNLEDLINQNEIAITLPFGHSNQYLFQEAHSGIYYEVNKKLLLVPESECYSGVLTHGRACIRGSTSLINFANSNCGKVYLAQEHFNPEVESYLFPKDAYFANLFNFYIQKLHENGVLKKIIDRYRVLECNDESEELATEADSIPIDAVGGVLILTGVIYVMGFFILAFELFWTRCLKRLPTECMFYD